MATRVNELEKTSRCGGRVCGHAERRVAEAKAH